MNPSFKNTNNFARTLRSSKSAEDEKQMVDRLFESDWDELVIRFDEARGQYVAKIALQPMVNETVEAA